MNTIDDLTNKILSMYNSVHGKLDEKNSTGSYEEKLVSRNQSKLIAHFRILGLSELLSKEQNHGLPCRSLLCQFKLFD